METPGETSRPREDEPPPADVLDPGSASPTAGIGHGLAYAAFALRKEPQVKDWLYRPRRKFSCLVAFLLGAALACGVWLAFGLLWLSIAGFLLCPIFASYLSR